MHRVQDEVAIVVAQARRMDWVRRHRHLARYARVSAWWRDSLAASFAADEYIFGRLGPRPIAKDGYGKDVVIPLVADGPYFRPQLPRRRLVQTGLDNWLS